MDAFPVFALVMRPFALRQTNFPLVEPFITIFYEQDSSISI
jgi:hypothetical protein